MNNAKRKKGPDHLHPDPSACAHCGWHPEEARARAWASRAIGLETGPDGLQRLVLRRK